ncbi:MAG: MBL fold metallo-hydrolase [Desulfobacula sp.]|jgi:glyoxylase-like metal-dependent hydrolase (beta-lactamase superfamily II)
MILSEFRFTALEGNSMKLDGGAMFGNAAKAQWNRWMPSDDCNMIPIGSRSLLIETRHHKILFETGTYLSPDMKERFRITENHHVLLASLDRVGLKHDDISHVILSHLHFDHAGGLLREWEEGRAPELLFPNAKFYVGKENFDRSCHPHLRDKASFIPGLCRLLEETGRLTLLHDKDELLLDEVTVEFIESQGHTPGMMLSYIRTPGQTLFFAGDIAPGHAWVHLPITMGYDGFRKV